MHCLSSYTLLEARISKTFPREAVNNHFWYQTNSRAASAMASSYEKPPHFVLEKTWDKKTQLPKTYKLQSNDSRDKIKAKVHQDSRKLGIEFRVDKKIPDFEKWAKKINLDFLHSFVEFENVLQGQYKTALKQVVQEHFPEPTDLENVPPKQHCHRAVELFIIKALHKPKPQDRQYIYMMPGGNYNV